MDKITLHVEGMACGHCEVTINSAIRKLPGVKKAKASRRKKEVSVEYDASLVKPDEMIHVINSTGYRVVP